MGWSRDALGQWEFVDERGKLQDVQRSGAFGWMPVLAERCGHGERGDMVKKGAA